MTGINLWHLQPFIGRGLALSVRAGLTRFNIRPFRKISGRLLVAPQDLRTADPTVASDIHNGYFAFAGRVVSTGGRSPYQVVPPSREWAEELYSFDWLRHMRAADTVQARQNARALIDVYLFQKAWQNPVALDTKISMRRLLACFSHSPLVLDGADHEFYRRFMRLIDRDIQTLNRALRVSHQPFKRLQAAIGLCYASLCCEGAENNIYKSGHILENILYRQILPDGGPATRNPRHLVELLLDLLPLRQTFAARGLEPPVDVTRAIDRMLPMLRLFRHYDGVLGLFNGMGLTPSDQLATLLAYDVVRAKPMQHSPYSGYERLEAKDTLVLVDIGAPPRFSMSEEAHAGCLSFELSYKDQHIVVNCGAAKGDSERSMAARSTAAHSTVSIDDLSSCRFLDQGESRLDRWIKGWLFQHYGTAIIDGPKRIQSNRGEEPEALVLTASHDGYQSINGINHQRRWRLLQDGNRLEGEDVFVRDPRFMAQSEAVIRFHLHPQVRARAVQNGRVVTLSLSNGSVWEFEAYDWEAKVEESMFFAVSDGGRKTSQITLTIPVEHAAHVSWTFTRMV